jgi:FKBP-type peptidyl-prolyl cis-trans isomerase FklB
VRRVWLTSAAIVLLLSMTVFAAEEPEKVEMKSLSEKASYAIGLEIGESLGRYGTAIDLPLLIRGIQDSLKGRKPLLGSEEATNIKREFFQKMQTEIAVRNLAEEVAFLDDNKNKQGVKTTASGLQYMVLKEGDGPTPKATDRVRVHYRGTLLDGTEFDSSYSRGEPTTFEVNRVIPGWTEGLQLMKVGSKYRLFIPSRLAYRDQGAGPRIGPNAMLVFEVELLGIEQ